MKINIISRTMSIQTLSCMIDNGNKMFFIFHPERDVDELVTKPLNLNTEMSTYLCWLKGSGILIEVIHEEDKNE